MNRAGSKLMTKGERELLAQTTKKRLAKLDVEELMELHARVRRARNKYQKLYRRQSFEQVKTDKSRGLAAPKNKRTSVKAEVFEDALSDVSSQLAIASKKSAKKLREQRLSSASPKPAKGAAGKNRAARRSDKTDTSRTKNSSKRKGDRSLKSPVSKKAKASSKATGKRRQAKKDGR